MAAFFQRNWWPRTDQPARIRFLLAPPWPARIRIKAYLETRPVVVSRRPLPKYNHRPIVGRDANYSISRFSTTSSPFSLSLKSSSLKLVRVEVCANLSGNRGWVFEIDDSICQGIMRYLQFSSVDLHSYLYKGISRIWHSLFCEVSEYSGEQYL